MHTRLIAKITIFGKSAWQTKNFEKYTYLGDPFNCCNILANQKCQELVLLFTNSNNCLDYVSQLLTVCKLPVTVGGVGNSVTTASRIISSGAEKIIVSDSLWAEPDKIELLSSRFGSQAIAASLDYIELAEGRVVVTGKDRSQKVCSLADALDRVEKLSVGEVILTNISRDGTKKGVDQAAYRLARQHLTGHLPVLLNGGFDFGDSLSFSSPSDGIISGTGISLFGELSTPLICYPTQNRVLS